MAKPIVVNLRGVETTFSFVKLERSKLYGRKRRFLLGPDNEPCQRAQLIEDGSLLLRSGMTAQGYFDNDGNAVNKSEFIGLSADGSLIELQPSTLGLAQDLVGPVTPEEVLDLKLTTVYQLTPENITDPLETSLANDDIYRFPLNYSADFRVETAYILKNNEGYFVIVGVPTAPEWSEPHTVPSEIFESSDSDDNDDLDFEMF
jgi:hypothetical protein